jgi:endonuclease/exonuclease/phosphatase family metal-dependent hydrolase
MISVLSYNLNLLPKGVNPVGHRYKSARLAEFTSKCLGEYDVMALQEVFSTPYLPAGFGCRQAQIVALAARHGYSAVRGRQPSLADMLTLNRVRHFLPYTFLLLILFPHRIIKLIIIQ